MKKEIAEAIKIYLEEEGYEVVICLDSIRVMKILQKVNFSQCYQTY